jgi:tRNA modification GTPase
MSAFIHESDTIVAVSTPRGYSGIGVIRISGPESLHILRRIFRASGPACQFPDRHAVRGKVLDPDTEKVHDDGLAIFMKGPNSYTGEDVVELCLHGNPLILDTAVRWAIRFGARLAGRGEFTRRAFLAGKLDLIQAEAVIDVIESKNLSAAEEARARLDGSSSAEICEISDGLKDVLAELEAHMDFDEDDEDPPPDPHTRLARTITRIQALKRMIESGRMRREGIRVVISGKPNVGKSTLFNALVRSDRVIVTPYPGTTRDAVDDYLVLDDIAFLLCDTAGIRDNPDPVEEEGIKRTRERIRGADVVVVVLDGSALPNDEDRNVLTACRGKRTLLVLNKMDLGLVVAPQDQTLCLGCATVPLSAKTGKGIGSLESRLTEIGLELLESDVHGGLSPRCLQPLESAEAHVGKALAAFPNGESMVPEIVSLELRSALSHLEEITGEKVDEGILDRIFERFCVGK